MITQKDFESKAEIRALPEQVQQKLTDFIYKEIPKVPFFKPDGKPKKEWKVFYGETWDAARVAALYSDYLITADLKFKDKAKHMKHIKARWEVWQKGYGLLCDVNGTLYVYAVKPKKPEKLMVPTKEQLQGYEERIAELEKIKTESLDKLARIRAILDEA